MAVAQELKADEGEFAVLVRRVTDTLRRRWLTFSALTLVIFGVVVALCFIIPPSYTAETDLRVDPTRTPMTNATANDELTPESIETELSLVNSDEVARMVVEKLNLVNDPEFRSKISTTIVGPADIESAVAAQVDRKLKVERNKLSYVLSIKFTSKDRIKAARIANAFADAYIFKKVGAKTDLAKERATFLRTQADALQADITASEQHLATYRAESGIASGDTWASKSLGTATDQEIGPVAEALAGAQADAATAKAALGSAQTAGAKGAENVPAVLQSQVIVQLRAQRALAVQTLGDLESRYGDRHPSVIAEREQLRQIDTQIDAETHRILTALNSQAANAESRKSALQGAIGALSAKQSSETKASVMANNLDAVITSKRAQLDKVSQALIEADQATGNQIAQIEIIDPAKPPIEPSFPKLIIMAPLGLVLGLMAGGGTIAVQEMLVTGLRTREEIEERLGLPMLAAIPFEKGNAVANIVIDRPTSLYSEAFRIARTSLFGARNENFSKFLAITSAIPSEGKSVTALSMARTMAISGLHTVLVDCDVRRAVLREMVGTHSTNVGLVEVLNGQAELEAAIEPGDVDKLDHLLVHDKHFSSQNLFGDNRMKQLLVELGRRYDLVVMDLPPLNGLADGRMLAALAEKVVMVVRWDTTPGNAVSSAVSALDAANVNIAGVLLTMVPSSAEAMGGLYYSKKYSDYYQQN